MKPARSTAGTPCRRQLSFACQQDAQVRPIVGGTEASWLWLASTCTGSSHGDEPDVQPRLV